MKKLILKEKSGRYRIIKANVPYELLSATIGKAIYEVVARLGEYQEYEEKKQLLLVPFAIGQKISYVCEGMKLKLTVSEITQTSKDLSLKCISDNGFDITFTQKDFELLTEEKE